MPDNWWNAEVTSSIILKHGKVVNADSSHVMDVWIKDGIIKEVSPTINPRDERTLLLDVTGMLVMPGGIDPNTHFEKGVSDRKPIDDLYYGTRAAVAGGTTMIMDFVVPEIGESMVAAYQKWRRKADCEVVCDYGLHMAISWWDKNVSKEMAQVTIGCGISSFMMYMSFKELYMLNDSELYQTCQRCRELGALAMIHAENGEIIHENTKRLLVNGIRQLEGFYMSRPEAVQAEATLRACVIANQVKCPLYICNVMCTSAAKIISEKIKEEYIVHGETTAAALGCNPPRRGTAFGLAAAYVTSPPISRKKSTPPNLMKLVASGDLVTIASNNCSYTAVQKAKGKNVFYKIPLGVNGVEDRMAVVWEKGVVSGIITQNQFVAATSTNAARLFNLYPKKGVIAVGSDADIVVWNPNKYRRISHYNQRQACDYNIFHKMKIHGSPEYVFVRGKLCVDGHVLKVRRGYGNYVYSPCVPVKSSPHIMEMNLEQSDDEESN